MGVPVISQNFPDLFDYLNLDSQTWHTKSYLWFDFWSEGIFSLFYDKLPV